MAHVSAWFELALIVIGLLWLVPVGVVCLQCLMAITAPRSAPLESGAPDPRPRTAVLMPAHNEASGILAAVQSVLAQLNQGDRLLVVADNCTDDTAAVVASAGAEVVQRHDPDRRGKGYALDFGVRHLEANAPDAVVIVDADCMVAAGAIDTLVRRCQRAGVAVQSLYLMQSPPDAGLKTRMAELAWIVKNHVRPLGFSRLGLPCQLMGSGMAFPWEQLRRAPLASGHIVEDMQLGLDLAAAGTPPMFCPQAIVSSRFPSDDGGLATQRTRWEHGHLQLVFRAGLPLLWRAMVARRLALAAMALDLCVPPLASLVLGLVVWLMLTAIFWWISGAIAPLSLAATALSLLSSVILAAWWRFGRSAVSLWELLSVPAYVLRKIPIYLKLLGKRQVEWVRTKRDDTRT